MDEQQPENEMTENDKHPTTPTAADTELFASLDRSSTNIIVQSIDQLMTTYYPQWATMSDTEKEEHYREIRIAEREHRNEHALALTEAEAEHQQLLEAVTPSTAVNALTVLLHEHCPRSHGNDVVCTRCTELSEEVTPWPCAVVTTVSSA